MMTTIEIALFRIALPPADRVRYPLIVPRQNACPLPLIRRRTFVNAPLSSQAISRRRLLQLGGVTALTMGVPGTVAARMDTAKKHAGAAEKSCIFILLCG